MGMLDRLFGSKVDFPPLPAGIAAYAQLERLRPPLEDLAHRVSDPLEVVPAADEAFVFVGKPPSKFGIAWVHDGKVSGLKELVEENHLSPGAAGEMIDRLGEAYRHASESPRYAAEIGGKQVVVIASDELEHEVHEIIGKATRH